MARKLLILASREPIPDRLLANGRTNPGPPEDPRENRGRGGLWKVPPPWEPAAKPARSHGGLEAFGSHTPHSLDGGIAYKPLTRGWVPFTRSGWVLFTLSKRSSSRIPPQSVEYTLNNCPIFRGHLRPRSKPWRHDQWIPTRIAPGRSFRRHHHIPQCRRKTYPPAPDPPHFNR